MYTIHHWYTFYMCFSCMHTSIHGILFNFIFGYATFSALLFHAFHFICANQIGLVAFWHSILALRSFSFTFCPLVLSFSRNKIVGNFPFVEWQSKRSFFFAHNFYCDSQANSFHFQHQFGKFTLFFVYGHFWRDILVAQLWSKME